MHKENIKYFNNSDNKYNPDDGINCDKWDY